MKIDGFQAFFTSFVVGTINILGLSLLMLGLRAEQGGAKVLVLISDFLKDAAPFSLILGAFATVIAVFVGQVVDAFGHLTLDKLLLHPRLSYTDPGRQRALEELIAKFRGVEGLDVPTAANSIFLSHAPEHLLSYRDDQWKTYEIYRNSVITMGIQLLGAVPLVFYSPSFAKWGMWLLSAILLSVFALGMKPCIKYLRKVEANYAIGWLYERYIAGVSQGALEEPQNPVMHRTPGLAPIRR